MRRSRVLRSKRVKSGRVRGSRKNISSKRKNNRKKKSRKMSKMKLSKSVKMRNRRSTQRLRKTRRNGKNRKNRKKRGGSPLDTKMILNFTRNYIEDYMRTNIGHEDDVTDISVSLDPTEEHLLNFFDKLDKDHNHAIDLEEFLSFGVGQENALQERLAVSENEAIAIFETIDNDNDGQITLKELAHFLRMQINYQFWTLDTATGYLTCERINRAIENSPTGRFAQDIHDLKNAVDWMRAYAESADTVLLDTGDYGISKDELALPKLTECSNYSDEEFLANRGFIVHNVPVYNTDALLAWVPCLEIPHDMIGVFNGRKVIDIPEAEPEPESVDLPPTLSHVVGSSDTRRAYTEMNAFLTAAEDL